MPDVAAHFPIQYDINAHHGSRPDNVWQGKKAEILEFYRLFTLAKFSREVGQKFTLIFVHHKLNIILCIYIHSTVKTEKRLISVLPKQMSVTCVRNKGISRARIEKNTSGSKDSGKNLAGQLVCRLKIWPQGLPEVTLPPESFPPIR